MKRIYALIVEEHTGWSVECDELLDVGDGLIPSED